MYTHMLTHISICTHTQDAGGDVSLTQYMTLPVEQYFVLDPSQIRHIGHNRFMLLVPRVDVSGVLCLSTLEK